jgi:hypothetical protein
VSGPCAVDDSRRPCVSASTDSRSRIFQDHAQVWFAGQLRYWAPFPCCLFDLVLAAEQGRPPVSSFLGLQFQRTASSFSFFVPVFSLSARKSIKVASLVSGQGSISFHVVYGSACCECPWIRERVSASRLGAAGFPL